MLIGLFQLHCLYSSTSIPCAFSTEAWGGERRARSGPGVHLHLLGRPWTRFFSELHALNSRAKPAVRNMHRTFKWVQSRQLFSACTSCIIIVVHSASTIYPWAIRFRDARCHLYPNREKTDLVSKPELKLKPLSANQNLWTFPYGTTFFSPCALDRAGDHWPTIRACNIKCVMTGHARSAFLI